MYVKLLKLNTMYLRCINMFQDCTNISELKEQMYFHKDSKFILLPYVNVHKLYQGNKIYLLTNKPGWMDGQTDSQTNDKENCQWNYMYFYSLSFFQCTVLLLFVAIHP